MNVEDRSDASTSRVIVRIASKPSASREEAWTRFSLIALRRNEPII